MTLEGNVNNVDVYVVAYLPIYYLFTYYYFHPKGSSYILKDPAHAHALRACLESLVAKVPQHEELLNTLDSGCGDGDCGTTLLLGIRGQWDLN